ncbi:MAG: TonB-dependent receptor plug domain-containing protein [Bacteroidota bacterium]
MARSPAAKMHHLCIQYFLTLLFTLPAAAQNSIHVRGRVTNETGQPVQRVSVVLKGTNVGVTGNDNGEFGIDAPSNGTLIFSAVDFKTIELSVSGRTSLDVTLVSVNKELEQVVVVGYGTQRKKDVTGAVVSINEQALREVPVANLQQALQGRAAGLEIQKIGTRPGAGAQIRIRGERSINGSNEPLIVVDGIPFEGGSLNDINPDDVSSVDVLKDASATAIYGSRGANGVIIISTKRGRTGEAKVSYNGYYGFGSVTKNYPVFNARNTGPCVIYHHGPALIWLTSLNQ